MLAKYIPKVSTTIDSALIQLVFINPKNPANGSATTGVEIVAFSGFVTAVLAGILGDFFFAIQIDMYCKLTNILREWKFRILSHSQFS